MKIFKRLLKIGQAEIHALVDKMENPMTLIEQSIADMKQDLSIAEENYIKTRASCIRTENMLRANMEKAKELDTKTKTILEKVKSEDIDQSSAEKLALQIIQEKNKLLDHCNQLNDLLEENNKKLEETNTHLEVIEFNIGKWEKELITLKTKQLINVASTQANKQMAHIDNNSTIQLLERMKAKIEDESALSEAYKELANEKTERLNPTEMTAQIDAKKELEALKKQLGLD